MTTRNLLLFLWLLLLSGCASTQEHVGEILQTKGATALHDDFKKSIEELVLYKQKLDLRNPNAYNKQTSDYLIREMQTHQNTIRMRYNGTALTTYDDYLRIAFDKTHPVVERNDFLILGLYKLLWESYKIGEGHQLSTLSYDEATFKKLYYYLSVVKWKIKTDKDVNGHYLFITWQTNWQIELQHKLNTSKLPASELINQLSSLQSNNETLLDPSNMNFEILLTQIIFHVKNSARLIGKEPADVGISAMMSAVLFL